MNQNHISWVGNAGLNPNPNSNSNASRDAAMPAMAMTAPSPAAVYPTTPSPSTLPSAPPPPETMPRYPLEPVRSEFQRNITGRREMPATEPDMMQGPLMMQGPPPVTDRRYIPGYLLTNVGRNVRAEFSIGSGSMMDKAGILREVGVNYFVLEDYISHALIMCDLYSVKFVTIL